MPFSVRVKWKNVLQHTRPVEKKKAKGVKHKVKDDHLYFAHYLDVLRSYKLYICKQNLISSTNHTVCTVHTKRWLCEDTVHAHLHGHNDTVSNPLDLFTKSCLVNCFTNVGIFSHNDLPAPTSLAEWFLSDV